MSTGDAGQTATDLNGRCGTVIGSTPEEAAECRHKAEVGRLLGKVHGDAAAMHEAVAYHHRQAVRFLEEGDLESARLHAARAVRHASQANESTSRAQTQTEGRGAKKGWYWNPTGDRVDVHTDGADAGNIP